MSRRLGRFHNQQAAYVTYPLPRIMGQLAKLRIGGMMIVSALLSCFGMAYLANAVGLAPIVGAFAAGLLLEEVHLTTFVKMLKSSTSSNPYQPFLSRFFSC
jgi:Kef-type K+ transport system membrane component KefB